MTGETCRKLRDLIQDDASWRAAFHSYFSYLPIRRIEPTSWKGEYLTRHRLARDWRKGKQSLQIDPRLGLIQCLYVDFDDSKLYIGTLEKGEVAICHPKTAKIEKDCLFSNQHREPMLISSMLLEKYFYRFLFLFF